MISPRQLGHYPSHKNSHPKQLPSLENSELSREYLSRNHLYREVQSFGFTLLFSITSELMWYSIYYFQSWSQDHSVKTEAESETSVPRRDIDGSRLRPRPVEQIPFNKGRHKPYCVFLFGLYSPPRQIPYYNRFISL